MHSLYILKEECMFIGCIDERQFCFSFTFSYCLAPCKIIGLQWNIGIVSAYLQSEITFCEGYGPRFIVFVRLL